MQRINLSDQVVTIIKDRVINGEYHLKEMLPSIADLASELGVGRSTIREALNRLEILGLVEVRHGIGIFITASKVENSTQLRSFTEIITALGMKPGAAIVKKEVVESDGALAEKLGIRAGECVNHLVRLRLADDLPMAVESSYTACRLFPGLLDKTGVSGSLYTLLKRDYQIEVHSALRTIQAVLTRPEENKLLGLQGHQPALKIETIAFDQSHFPIEYGISLYRADRYQFVIEQSRYSSTNRTWRGLSIKGVGQDCILSGQVANLRYI